jgi:hypothetical protein
VLLSKKYSMPGLQILARCTLAILFLLAIALIPMRRMLHAFFYTPGESRPWRC